LFANVRLSIANYAVHYGSVTGLVPSRNSSTYLYVAKLRCRHTTDSWTALATVLKLVFRFGGFYISRQL